MIRIESQKVDHGRNGRVARDELAVALYYSELDPIARDRIVVAHAMVRAALDEMIQISRHYTAPHDTPRHATTRTN